MSDRRLRLMTVLPCVALSLVWVSAISPATAQVLETMEKIDPEMGNNNMGNHHLHLPLGPARCSPKYTYEEGDLGPGHWPGVCKVGNMQSPIDITTSQKLPVAVLKFAYKPVDLDLINDCNQYRILVKFPDNYWLMVGKKPYNLAEVHFRSPGENAVNGKRPPMSVQFVHFSPEGTFLIVEVPIVAGKENPLIRTLWRFIPNPGAESNLEGITINPADLLPADHSFYSYPGSLTTPICNEGVHWYVMKNPIELSQAQIDEYTKHYPNSARPLQPLNGRPVAESR